MNVSITSDGDDRGDNDTHQERSSSAQSLLTGLQALTRRLQDERDALQLTLDDTTRALQSERAARASLENVMQVRELELLHMTQTHAHTSQQLRARITELERELDDERTAHHAAVVGRTAAVQKSAALADEVKKADVKWHHEAEKRELALAEIEILRDDARHIALDREQLVARTESDAKRVRALWTQIAHEHAHQLESVRLELETAQRATASAERTAAEHARASEALHATVTQLNEQLTNLQQHVDAATNGCNQQLEAAHKRDQERDACVHRLELQLAQQTSACALATQREAAATREQKLARAVLTKCQRELDAKHEALLALQREYSDLLDANAQRSTTQTQYAHAQHARVARQLQTLAERKQCADELVALQSQQLARYQRVLASVGQKLTDVHDAHDALVRNAWPLYSDTTKSQNKGSKTTSSLCIYRH